MKADNHYAAQNGQTPSTPYTTWVTAASSIQDAVDAATTNDMVWIGAGRYTMPTNAVDFYGSNVVYINKPLTLRSSNSVPATTIIDGEGVNRGITVNSSAGSAYSFVLDGFTVSNCFATNFGGGILFTNVLRYTVRNCVISDNTVSGGAGGGIYLCRAGTTFVLTNCVIRDNQATNAGGGACILGGPGPVNINNCLIQSNSTKASAGQGGGVFAGRVSSQTDPPFNVENCEIIGNSTYEGGGFYFWSWASPVRRLFRNCLMYNNRGATSVRGGAISTWGTWLVLDNCTIVDNSSPGIYLRSGALLQMCNTIIYSNGVNYQEEGTDPQIYLTNSCSFPSNEYTSAGTGNITNPPTFVDFAGKNFRLTPASPCANAGLNQDWMAESLDLDRHSRIDKFSGTVDMGAYEYLPRGIMFKVR